MKKNHLPRRGKLRQAIWEANLLQSTVADLADMTSPVLSEIISGKRNPSDEEADRLARVLGATRKALGI